MIGVAACVRSEEDRPSPGLIGLLCLLSLFIGATVWAGDILSPVFIEKMMAGWVPMDPLYHSAIGEMWNLHRVSSVGLDGLASHPYHIGSHIWFASLANLVGVRPWLFYQAGYPVAIVPLALYALLSFARSVRAAVTAPSERDAIHIGLKEWAFLSIVIIGVLPHMVTLLTHSENLILVSESFATALMFVFFSASGSSICSQTSPVLRPSIFNGPCFFWWRFRRSFYGSASLRCRCC